MATIPVSSLVMAVTSLSPWNTSESNFSEVPTVTDLPVVGLSGSGINFYILHITAIVSLSISIIASLAVFGILRPTCPAFWSRTMGERFAVYLALGDLMYSISHFADHAYMLAVVWHPPDDICVVMGFFVSTFVLVQSLMVSFMALNAFILVVKETKISLGKYDWKFLSVCLLVPVGIFAPCAYMRWLGPSGGWCVYDMRKEMGKVMSMILTVGMTVTIAVNVFSYVFVFFKIRSVTAATQAMGSTTGGVKYSKTVSVMMKFVAAYIFQWWAYMIYSLWNLVTPPPFFVLHSIVFLANMGGLFNLIVYTLLRKMGRSKKGEKTKPGPGAPSQSQATSVTTLNSNVDPDNMSGATTEKH